MLWQKGRNRGRDRHAAGADLVHRNFSARHAAAQLIRHRAGGAVVQAWHDGPVKALLNGLAARITHALKQGGVLYLLAVRGGQSGDPEAFDAIAHGVAVAVSVTQHTRNAGSHLSDGAKPKVSWAFSTGYRPRTQTDPLRHNSIAPPQDCRHRKSAPTHHGRGLWPTTDGGYGRKNHRETSPPSRSEGGFRCVAPLSEAQ